jgi:uncharacterized integral membrane protein
MECTVLSITGRATIERPEHDMRLIRPVLAIVCLGLGIFVGLLNRDAVTIDLGPAAVHTTLGVALLGAFLAGALAGGLAMALSRSISSRRNDASRSSGDVGPEI